MWSSQSSDYPLTSSAYQNTYLLYTMHFCFAFTARMWDMGIVLLLSELSNNNLTLVAFAGFLTNLFIVLFMGSVGHFLDKTNRLVAAKYALGTKFLSIAFTYSLCAYFNYLQWDGQEVSTQALYIVPIISAIANLSFSAVSTSVEKDWIVVLASGDSRWLSKTNSRMTQIDSICNAIAPAVTGLLFIQFSPSIVSLILLVTNTISTLCLYIFMESLYHSWAALSIRETRLSSSSRELEMRALLSKTNADITEEPEGYFHDFLHSGCAGTMLSYSFLYLTVLSYGSLMVVYLRWSHLSDGWIGAGRGAGAITGLLGATLFPYFSDCFGIYRASNYALLFQFSLVVVACASFFFDDTPYEEYGIAILCISVLLSRTGLWMFDLGVRQIAQEKIPEYCRGKVNGQWKSIISFFEMTVYVMAATISDPQYFWLLAVISTVMVGSALVLFTTTRPDLFENS